LLSDNITEDSAETETDSGDKVVGQRLAMNYKFSMARMPSVCNQDTAPTADVASVDTTT
jgi:hypothetical protein